MENIPAILSIKGKPKIPCCRNSSKIIERGNIDTPSTYIHDCSLSWLGTVTSINNDGVKLGKFLFSFTVMDLD